MTKLLLPKMLAHKKGIIVNLSSASSLFPIQMSAVYSATKVSMILRDLKVAE